MPKLVKPLTVERIKSLKPKLKPYKEFDGGGLYLLVTPPGSKLWRFDYRFGEARKTLALGAHPAVSLDVARAERERAKTALREGRDPGAKATIAAAAPVAGKTFREAAQDWLTEKASGWTPEYALQVGNRLHRDLYPEIGDKPIEALTKGEIKAALIKVQARGVNDTARRLKQYTSAIFEHASDTIPTLINPTPKTGLKAPPKTRHNPTLHGAAFGVFLHRLETGDLERVTMLALKFALLTAARTKEVRYATWEEVSDWKRPEKALWRLTPERMKKKRPHLVPLSRQACEVLRAIHEISAGRPLIFPGIAKDGALSDNTLLFAVYRLGFHSKQSVHGFRSTFSTWANESGYPADHVEKCLSHDRDDVRAVYNAAQYLPQRRELLQAWADHLDTLLKRGRDNERFGDWAGVNT